MPRGRGCGNLPQAFSPPTPPILDAINLFFFFSSARIGQGKRGMQSAERLDKIYMRNDLFSNPPPTEIPPFQEPVGAKEWEQFLAERQRAAWGCKEANAVSRVSCGQKGHMGKGRGRRGAKSRDHNTAANSAGPFPCLLCSQPLLTAAGEAAEQQERGLPIVMPVRENINCETLKHCTKRVYTRAHTV